MSGISLINKTGSCWMPLLPSWSAALRIALPPLVLPRMIRELLERGSGEAEKSISELFGNGTLLAVPKKKVSHQKKRQKLYGPGRKQLDMIHHLNRCPSCGHFKRANTLCMHCVGEIRHIWKAHTVKETPEPQQEAELSDLDRRILYPGKKETEYVKKLKDKETYLERRMRTLHVKD
ncbi:LAFA_0G14642g1_1 [Lachancea sp. 'fantastica']|nr:LAFA_0G14642g1_1 [Lachancea sp. 'fantastica']